MARSSADSWILSGPGGIKLSQGARDKVVDEATRRIRSGERSTLFLKSTWNGSNVLELVRRDEKIWMRDTCPEPRATLIEDFVKMFRLRGVTMECNQQGEG